MVRSRCSFLVHYHFVVIQTNNLRRLLHTVEALSELGPALTAEREFSETSRLMLSAVMEAAGAREGVLLLFSDKPAMLSSAATHGIRARCRIRPSFLSFPSTCTR